MSLAVLAALSASIALASPRPIAVLSFNVAGVPVVHPQIGARIKAIGALLAKGGYDVVALQEVWRDGDAEALRRASGMNYSARAPQQWPFGDGLLILSRWRVLESRSLAFDARTEHWFRVDGEQLAHKGALLARLAAPGGELDVVDTHLVSDYVSHANPAARARQIEQLLPWVEKLTRGRRLALAGDLNMPPEDPLVARLRGALGLKDACASGCGPTIEGSRIDYVMTAPGLSQPAAQVTLDESVSVGGKRYRVSDHRAILAVFQ